MRSCSKFLLILVTNLYFTDRNWIFKTVYSLRYADNRKYFSGLSLTRNRREAHVLPGERRGENLDMFLLRKGNFIMINEFRYGQTWKIWLSPLSLSLYRTFKCKTYLNSKVLRIDFKKEVIIKEQVCGMVLRTKLLREISNIANHRWWWGLM